MIANRAVIPAFGAFGRRWYNAIDRPLASFSFNQPASLKNGVRSLQPICSILEAVNRRVGRYPDGSGAYPGAVAVFVAFTAYSQGPLPEDLLAVHRPAIILWGK